MKNYYGLSKKEYEEALEEYRFYLTQYTNFSDWYSIELGNDRKFQYKAGADLESICEGFTFSEIPCLEIEIDEFIEKVNAGEQSKEK